jgi:peptidoglycan hydrolase-like protein with peptidoglycan-binding domain
VSSEQTEAGLRLSQQSRSSVQQRLTLLGHDTKGTDGRFGANTRVALKAWQAKNGLPETGFLDQAQLTKLNSQTEAEYRQFVAAQAAQAAQRRAAEPPRPEPARTYEPAPQHAPRQPAPAYQPAPVYQPYQRPAYEPPAPVYRPPPPPPPAQEVNPGQMLNTINQGLDLFKRLR